MNEHLELISELIRLTNNDQLKWQRPILNIHSTERNGWEFYTEMPQDDRPLLEVHHPDGKRAAIEAYGCGIKELNSAINEQYRRFGLYEYSVEYQNNLKKLEEKRLEENRQRAEDLAELTRQLKKESCIL